MSTPSSMAKPVSQDLSDTEGTNRTREGHLSNVSEEMKGIDEEEQRAPPSLTKTHKGKSDVSKG